MAASSASSGSLKTIDWLPILNLRCRNAAGVGADARGYCRESKSLVACGGRKINGGKVVVVVVVVVTTVVRVVGAKENWPKALPEGPCTSSSVFFSSISRVGEVFWP